MFNDSLKPLLQLFARLAWYNIGYIDWESWLAQDYTKEAAEACQYLAMLRPESIVSPIVDKLLLSIDNLIEAHRFTSLMHCLKRMTRQLVRQTSSYFQGQTYILPLLMSVLPGIDLNDIEKTSMTLDFFDAIFMLISCVDCSSAVHTRNDLNEDSYEAIAKAIQNLLRSLLNIYPMNYRLTREKLDEPFIDFLPIRIWGQNADFDQIQVQYHIPNVDEIDFACDFVNTFIYSELMFLKENFLKVSKDERLRSLTVISSLAIGCFRIVSRIESKEVPNL
ncbi:unnamed protein product [Rotaria sp. Silwood1]|nr:unnamed protein product [Rotaria sp. Silwood1]